MRFAIATADRDAPRKDALLSGLAERTSAPFHRFDFGAAQCLIVEPDTYLRDWSILQRASLNGTDSFISRHAMPLTELTTDDLLRDLMLHARLNARGVFAVVAGAGDEIRVAGDALGIYPIYVADGPSGLAVSDDACAAVSLAGQPIEFDLDASLEWIITEGNLDYTDPLRNVRRLRGEEILSIKPGARFSFLRRTPTATEEVPELEDLVEGLMNDLRIVARHAHQIVCNLTAGYDSRINLALLRKAGVEFFCRTQFHPCHDSAVASRITNRLGITHHLNWLPKDDRTWPVFISGNGAATVKGHYYKKSRTFQDLENDLLSHYLTPYRSYLCGSRKNAAILRERVIDEYERLYAECGDAYHALDLLHLDRSRSWYGRGLLGVNKSTVSPLLDQRFIRFGRRYSPKEKAERRVNLDIIEFLEPELLEFEFNSAAAGKRDRLPSWIQRQAIAVDAARKTAGVSIPDEVADDSVLYQLFSRMEIRRLFATGKSHVRRFVEYENSVHDFRGWLSAATSGSFSRV